MKSPHSSQIFSVLVSAALALPASAALYEQNFDGVADGSVDVGDGSVFAGTANVQGEQLELTRDGVAGGFSSFTIPAIENSSLGWTASFDLTIIDGAAAEEPADGMSFNYGNFLLGDLGGAEEGMHGNNGTATENLSFEIDTWMNLDTEQGVNIAEAAGGVDTNLEFTNGSILADGTTVSGNVVVSWTPLTGASFSTTGLLTNAAFVDVPTTFAAGDDLLFGFSARVGGANETVLIDNLVIETSSAEDTDGDGLPDDYERQIVGADDLTILGGPENDAESYDADGDGLFDFDEYDPIGTNPIVDDTDMDGLLDGVENNNGEWDGIDATGTDPLNPDSDADDLVDGVENPDLPYDSANPETQPGTDPNIADTDDDRVSDGAEIELGRDPTVSDGLPPGYFQGFDGFADGATDVGDGSIFAGTANVQGGQLELTRDGVAGGFASFSVPAMPDSSLGWVATFDLTIIDSPGANEPADGMSFNYGDANLGELGSAEEGMAGIGAVTENISFEIDTWMNLDSEQGVNIAQKVGGVDTNLAFTNGSILADGTTVSGEVMIEYDPAAGLSFSTTGLLTNADFALVPTDFVGDDEYTFILSARVGGANETLLIDNLNIVPGSPDDTDGDGLSNSYEIANGLDPDDNGLNPNNNGVEGDPDQGADGDPDMDTLTNTEERDLGTDPQEADTDMDGLDDNVENNSGAWGGLTATGTDPTNADTDGDTLADGLENPDLPHVPGNPTTQPGTDPNNPDTDEDTVSDAAEIIQGRDPTVPDPIPSGYVQSFDGFANGATELNDGSVMNGTANIQDGQLELTRNDVAGGFASFMIPAIANSQNGWTATFDLTISDGAGANEPADGMSFNYGNFELTELGSAEEGMAAAAAVSENISFEVDTWMNLDAEQGVNIAEKVGGLDTDLSFTNGSILADGTTVGGPVVIVFDPVGGLSFTTEGLLTNADFEEIATTFVGAEAYNFGISARVGGANQTLLIDNLVISLGTGGAPLAITDIEYTPDTGDGTAETTITWSSRSNRTYTVYASKGMRGAGAPLDLIWEELDDGVDSQGETTSFTESGIPAGTTERFYRVEEQQ